MECFSSLSSCPPCCLLAPRWSFSDPNADCSALPKRDAKRRGRHQNRLLDWRLHHQVPLSFLTSPGCGVGRALILGKGRQWRVVTLPSAAKALLRLLVDTAGTRTHRWMPRSAPSSVWQTLLTPEVVPMLVAVEKCSCPGRCKDSIEAFGGRRRNPQPEVDAKMHIFLCLDGNVHLVGSTMTQMQSSKVAVEKCSCPGRCKDSIEAFGGRRRNPQPEVDAKMHIFLCLASSADP
ncbi:uncharacterized protein LOC121106898 [Gallus gallus]|uniref:uncharacterized protein LOC121106898 n=1 Tax=Gallus gallus TaxID=9031 RepID=UPI001AE65A2D|nr:uncharacterized protein LOC121106898 [Gallus gallus]